MDLQTTLFNVFQPLCVKLIEDGSYEDLGTLHRALQLVDTTIPLPLQEYVLFPLRVLLLKNKEKTDTVHKAIDCISLTLEKSESMRTLGLFKELLFQIITFLTDPMDFGNVVNVSEELKESYIRCLAALFKKAETSVLKELYIERYLPELAHLTTLLLNVVQNDVARHVRIAAMNLLSDIGLHDRTPDIQKQSASVFATFIPKISIELTKVALGDTVQGHVVTSTAVQTWTHLVTLVMKDEHLKDMGDSQRTSPDNEVSGRSRPKLVERNETWLKTTSTNICTLIDQLTELVSHSHWKVRLVVVEWAGHLLLECSNSLQPSRGKLLEVILTLMSDDMNSVSKKSEKLLNEVASTFGSSDSFLETVEDNLFDLVTRLPRTLHNFDDAKKLSQLHLLAGYLRLLGGKIVRLLRSQSHMNRLTQTLLQLSEMDCSSIHIVALKTTSVDYSGDCENIKLMPIKKTFHYFTDENIASALIDSCRLLGKQGDLDYLVDHFTEIFNSSSTRRKEVAFVLNELVLGNSATIASSTTPQFIGLTVNDNNHMENTKKLPILINALLNGYLQPEIWSLPVCADARKTDGDDDDAAAGTLVPRQHFKDSKDVVGIEKLNDNILLICTLLEGIGHFSEVLGLDFIPCLRHVLYPLLDKMGSTSAMVSHTATYVAMRIASNTGYKFVAKMIHANADYLVDQLAIKLRFVLQNPEAPQILRVAVQNSRSEILPLLKDCIEELLYGLDNYHVKKMELFMEALFALVFQVEKWFSINYDQQTNRSSMGTDATSKQFQFSEKAKVENHKEDISFEGIRNYFLNYHKLKEAAKGNIENFDDIEVGEDDAEEDSSEIKKESPYHVQLVIQLLERCVHLIPNKNLTVSVYVLDSVNVGLLALQQHEDDLLPMVHKLWQPLVARFNDQNLVIVKKIFLIICTMANISKQFISRKVLDDIWKKITNFLRRQAKISHAKNARAYHFTAAYKLQYAMLTNIALLTKRLDLTAEHHDGLIRCCLPYLSCQQPQELQDAALEAFETMYSYEPDLVWLYFQALNEDSKLKLPHLCFKPVQLSPCQDVETEHKENITRLIVSLRL